jgi:hypothetical protein
MEILRVLSAMVIGTMKEFSWNACIFESWKEPEFDYEMSWNFVIQPKAKKEISAAQTYIENQRFFDILVYFSVFWYYAAQKANIFSRFSKLRPRNQFGLATPALDLYSSTIPPKINEFWVFSSRGK